MSSTILDQIRKLLIEAGVEFREVRHEPTRTSEESAIARGEELGIGGKSLLIKIDDTFRLFVLSADRKLDSAAIKEHFGAKKTRFATANELLALTGLMSGSVPPFGHPILPFPLYVDPSVLENPRVAFNAGSLTDSMIVGIEHYQQLAQPEVFTFAKITNEDGKNSTINTTHEGKTRVGNHDAAANFDLKIANQMTSQNAKKDSPPTKSPDEDAVDTAAQLQGHLQQLTANKAASKLPKAEEKSHEQKALALNAQHNANTGELDMTSLGKAVVDVQVAPLQVDHASKTCRISEERVQEHAKASSTRSIEAIHAFYDKETAGKYSQMMASEKELQFYRKDIKSLAVKALPNHFFLDVGCGCGDLLNLVHAENPELMLRGVDPVDNMLNYARKLVPSATFEIGSASSINFADNSVGALICTFVTHHLNKEDFDVAITEFARVTVAGAPIYHCYWHGVGHIQSFVEADLPVPLIKRTSVEVDAAFEKNHMFKLEGRHDSYEWGDMAFAIYVRDGEIISN